MTLLELLQSMMQPNTSRSCCVEGCGKPRFVARNGMVTKRCEDHHAAHKRSTSVDKRIAKLGPDSAAIVAAVERHRKLTEGLCLENGCYLKRAAGKNRCKEHWDNYKRVANHVGRERMKQCHVAPARST